MTKDEFKAWFDGFTEGIEKTPTDKQWERIKERVKEISGGTLTQTIFMDRYVRQYPDYRPYWMTSNAYDQNKHLCLSYSAGAAMSDLGKHEFLNLSQGN